MCVYLDNNLTLFLFMYIEHFHIFCLSESYVLHDPNYNHIPKQCRAFTRLTLPAEEIVEEIQTTIRFQNNVEFSLESVCQLRRSLKKLCHAKLICQNS